MDNELVNILKDTIAMQKQNNKRMFVIVIILILMLVITNIGWLIYESQFETVSDSTSMYSEDNGTNVYGSNNSINGEGVSE